MILKGFKFGMLLQLAIGPVCFYIFDTGSKKGFLAAESSVLAVAIVDAFFILLAILGITAFLKNDKINSLFKILGSAILAFFGIKTIMGSISVSPGNYVGTLYNPFVVGLMLTISNPLTILFWAGVFTSKITEDKFEKKSLFLFGLGAVLSTIVFLSGVGAIGSIAASFLPPVIISILNAIVGIVFLYFAIKLLVKKKEQS
ncbi:LysE family translocator [Acetivibrio cellulolyticus]|uniref:LysE family translocator n=1 Tax=Acetivibrio cellulolyticus TaxID=35830 RepID=UPI0001E2D504|nr:LysE family transporter [Acetivibrio cellulolyticus]